MRTPRRYASYIIYTYIDSIASGHLPSAFAVNWQVRVLLPAAGSRPFGRCGRAESRCTAAANLLRRSRLPPQLGWAARRQAPPAGAAPAPTPSARSSRHPGRWSSARPTSVLSSRPGRRRRRGRRWWLTRLGCPPNHILLALPLAAPLPQRVAAQCMPLGYAACNLPAKCACS